MSLTQKENAFSKKLTHTHTLDSNPNPFKIKERKKYNHLKISYSIDKRCENVYEMYVSFVLLPFIEVSKRRKSEKLLSKLDSCPYHLE